MSTLEVSVFECASCGAPLPFGDGDTLACLYCGASVAVPEEHRSLRAAEREYNLHRTDALALLRKLGKTPFWLVRFLTNANGVTVIGLISLGTIVSGVLCYAFFALVSRFWLAAFHVHLDDVVLYRYDPSALFMIGQFAFLLTSLGSLVVLGAYARRRGAGLRELQAGLSAHPPKRPGGPATCRSCGAPLTAQPETLAVTCAYCRSDNLLKIRESWLGTARSSAKKLARAVEEAAYAFQGEERDIRRSLVVRLVVVGLISSTSLFLFVGVTNGAELEFSTTTPYRRTDGALYNFDWQQSSARPSLTLDQGDVKGCFGIGCSPPLSTRPCAELRPPSSLVVPAGACDAEACTLHWYVALRHGDTVEVTASELPPKSFILLKSHARGAHFHKNPITWGPQVPEAFAWLGEGQPARLPAAPHDGWFQLVLGLRGSIPGTRLPFCARLERPGP